jgi:hypothetical protein
MSYIINFTFCSDKTQANYSIELSISIDEMLEKLVEQAVLCPYVDNEDAREEEMNFLPPFAAELSALDFTITKISGGFPIPNQSKWCASDILIELSEMAEGELDHGQKFIDIYPLCNDANQAIEILECIA